MTVIKVCFKLTHNKQADTPNWVEQINGLQAPALNISKRSEGKVEGVEGVFTINREGWKPHQVTCDSLPLTASLS